MYHSSQFCPKQPSTVACGLGNYNSHGNVPSRPADLCLCGPRPFTTFPGLWTLIAMGYYLLLAPPQAQSRRIVDFLNRGLGPGRQVWRPMVCPEPVRLKNPAWSVSFQTPATILFIKLLFDQSREYTTKIQKEETLPPPRETRHMTAVHRLICAYQTTKVYESNHDIQNSGGYSIFKSVCRSRFSFPVFFMIIDLFS